MWTHGESNPDLIHAMDLFYRYTMGPITIKYIHHNNFSNLVNDPRPILKRKMRYNGPMNKTTQQNWQAFVSKAEIWFFCMFLATFSLSIRKVIYHIPIQGIFNEYSGVYIYLSDIFLLLTFISFILYNINYYLSSLNEVSAFLKKKLSWLLKLFHVKHFFSQQNNDFVPRGTKSTIKNIYQKISNNFLIIFPLFLAFFSFISIEWSQNKTIALYRSIKLLEYILLYFYIKNFVPRGTKLNQRSTFSKKFCTLFHVEQMLSYNKIQKCDHLDTTKICSTLNKFKTPLLIIIIVALAQSTIGIFQFVNQCSIGLFWLKESKISPIIPGVAKVILRHQVLIRAYGLLPHPNILGGYLVFSIIISLLLSKLLQSHIASTSTYSCESNQTEQKRKTKKSDSNNLLNCSMWNNLTNYILNIVPRGTILLLVLLRIIITIELIALLLTISKSAYIGLFIAFLYISLLKINNNVPRETLLRSISKQFKMFHVKHLFIKLALICLILLFSIILVKPDFYSLFVKSLVERGFYLNVSRGTLMARPLLGIGAGQFIFQLLTIPGIQNWQFQPVHNVFLLIANEYGILVALGFILFLTKLLQHRNCSTWNNYTNSIITTHVKGVLFAFIFIMIFDHYFWDIQQGQMLLWLTLGIIAS